MTQCRIIQKLVIGVLCLSGTMLNSQVLGGYLELDRNVNTVQANAAILFRCCPLPVIDYLKINWGDGSQQDSIPLKYPVPQFVPSGGYVIFYFTGSHTYTPGAVYSVTAGGISFESGFQNIPNSSSWDLVLRGMINMQVWADPPVSSQKTIIDSVYCESTYYNDYVSSPGMQSNDGDSLAFSIDLHSDISGYVPPPVGWLSGNPAMGTITFTANASGDYNVSYRADAWRRSTVNSPYDILTGTSYLEIYVPVCNIYLPSTVGLIENRDSDGFLNLYPNPTDKAVIVTTNMQGEKQVSLMTVTGQHLIDTEKTEEQFSLDMSDYASGVYFLFVRSKTRLLTRKIVRE